MNKFNPTLEQIEKMIKTIDKFEFFVDEVFLIVKKYDFNHIQAYQILITVFQGFLEEKQKEKEKQNED